MNETFNQEAVVSTAVALRQKGLTWAKVAEEMAKDGITNKKGKPYSEGGIHTIVSLKRPDVAFRRESEQVNARTASSKSLSIHMSPTVIPTEENKTVANREKGIINLCKTIIKMSGVSAEEKIELLDRALSL